MQSSASFTVSQTVSLGTYISGLTARSCRCFLSGIRFCDVCLRLPWGIGLLVEVCSARHHGLMSRPCLRIAFIRSGEGDPIWIVGWNGLLIQDPCAEASNNAIKAKVGRTCPTVYDCGHGADHEPRCCIRDSSGLDN